MALTNNLATTLKDFPVLKEAMAQRQPGDKLKLTIEVTIVENLTDRATYDVDAVDSVATIDAAADDDGDAGDDADATLKDSVLGVMSRKGK